MESCWPINLFYLFLIVCFVEIFSLLSSHWSGQERETNKINKIKIKNIRKNKFSKTTLLLGKSASRSGITGSINWFIKSGFVQGLSHFLAFRRVRFFSHHFS